MATSWFEVSKTGLAKTVDRRGKAFVFYELLQNSFDAKATKVEVFASPVTGQPKVRLQIIDNAPGGFRDLDHAYTLFADSAKKTDVGQAGKFNLGEKLVLAISDKASIISTSGGLTFDSKGRHNTKETTRVGTRIEATLRMTREELSEALAGCRSIIPPKECEVTINSDTLPRRALVTRFDGVLQTEIADDERVLRKADRKTSISVYEVLPGEVASIYELGIPVVETGDKYHVVVHQRVPVSLERDNVPPAYLRRLRALVLNMTNQTLTEQDAASSWVTDATTDKALKSCTLKAVLERRFGERVASYDPSDKEANHKLVAEGYQIIHGGSLPGATWAAIKEHGLVKPSGQISPTKPTSFVSCKRADPDTQGQAILMCNFKVWGKALLGIDVRVEMIDDTRVTNYASWNTATKTVTLNRAALGTQFFERGESEEAIALAIHEFAHECGGDNHLSSKYYDECCALGARLARWMKGPV
jgi:hypothetical protein